jgi:hypothetical protein
MNTKLHSKAVTFSVRSENRTSVKQIIKRSVVLIAAFVLFVGLTLPFPFVGGDRGFYVSKVSANGTYYNFAGGNLTLSLIGPDNRITSNDDWSGIASVEGYSGRNLTNTHGINPQTVLGTEAACLSLPCAGQTQVNADKGNPSAFNAGGVTEFDRQAPYAFGIQGNVQSNPYLVFYLNTTGRSNVTISYDIVDIDFGSNDSVSQVALQYRVGQTGNFTNLPDGYVADATVKSNPAPIVTSRSVVLPAAANNQSQVQVRLITTNAADSGGASTPDEWIGINNVVISAFFPTVATANVGGQAISSYGRPLANATITIYAPNGTIRTARTNTFGYYNFEEVPVGETYVLEIRSKRFYFPQPSQVITVNDNLDSVNFYAEQFFNLWTDYSGRF